MIIAGVSDCAVMDRNPVYRSGITSAAVVELAATTRMFYTRTIGSPDVLFMVLLASARKAYAITAASAPHPERDNRAQGFAAEIYLAGSLLCDASFVPARVPPGVEHRYILDLVNQEIQLSTRVCGATAGRISLFGVTLKGSIHGREFALINTNTKALLANVSEDVIKKPDFFRDELPRLACQTEPHQAEGGEESRALIDQEIELHVVIPLREGSCALELKKNKAARRAEVYSAEDGRHIGYVGLGCLQRIIRAGQNQANTVSPGRPNDCLSCFLEFLPVVIHPNS